jgi:hypothetical protein
MTLLIYSGLLYLLGVSLVLTFKPEIMFTKEGAWKEFGLGRNHHRYTWMPFWLFSIVWAIMSYVIILVIASNTGLGGVSMNTDINVSYENIDLENVSRKSMKPALTLNRNTADDMKQGYYILDANETAKQGVEKYVFLGPAAPNIIYRPLSTF